MDAFIWLIALLTTNDLQTGCKAAIFFGVRLVGGMHPHPSPMVYPRLDSTAIAVKII